MKDIIDVAGWATRCGSRFRDDFIAAEDAPVVANLRRAGAILLGKTVTTEFACFDPPPTANPWRLDRTPGGSSSGSAAAVAAEMCLAAVGSQTGGSIIRPAAFCGVVGYKPPFDVAPGAPSRRGVFPLSRHLDHVGPLARTAADAALVARVLLAFDEQGAPAAATEAASEDATPPATEPRLAWCGDALAELASPDALRLARDARDQLQGADLPSPSAPLPPGFEHVHACHRVLMAVDAAVIHRRDFLLSAPLFGPHVAALVESGLTVSAVDYATAQLHQRQFQAEAAKAWGEWDAVLMPATVTTAPGRETTGDPALNSPWSYAGLPAITLPCGLDADGLPAGLQLVGTDPARLLAAAQRCEAALAFAARPAILTEND